MYDLGAKVMFFMASFSISSEAAARINEVNLVSAKNDFLQITVDSGGCNGMRYKFEFTNKIDDNCQIFNLQKANVAIDELSLQFLEGAMLHFEEEIGQANFVIKNPNAASSCGCGESFSVR